MSATLVQSFPQVQLTDTTTKPLPLTFTLHTPALEPLVAQLAHLASQHHTSEYNCLKFGVHGCPIRYFPLSLYLPEHFRTLQLRQAHHSQAQSWWYCHRPEAPKEPSVVVLGPCGIHTQETIDIQDEIRAAMAAPLDHNPPPTEGVHALHSPMKTSSTHPINISSIISPELVPLISSHLLTSPSSSRVPATVFEIPPSFTLDRLVLSPARYHLPQYPIPAESFAPPTSVSKGRFALGRLRSRSGVSEALQAAITSSLSAVNATAKINKIKRDSAFKIGQQAPEHGSLFGSAQPMIHPNTSSVSLSLSLTMATTPSLLPTSSKHSSLGVVDPSSVSPTGLQTDLQVQGSIFIPPSSHTPHTHQDKGLPIAPPSIPLNSSPPSLSNPLLIGNLFLSSCPGKKVRLLGPVKGRSGVCRDLDVDLKRMKDLGVGCIVCCLDDEELDLLGVPWLEYRKSANDIGLDVLRIPTPEGLAPLTPASLNTQLMELINKYTLCGTHVLVHCRGGVGRAGVIACCWLIKLGLCGWVEIDNDSTPILPPPHMPLLTSQAENNMSTKNLAGLGFGGGVRHDALRGDTVQFVEKIIAVVRKRRSLKAVETYEQVRFLVDFVEYLREGTVDAEP